MNMNKSTYEKRLLRSFDEDLSSNELRLLETALASDASLREYKKSVMQLRQNLEEYEATFSAGFEDRVAARLKLGKLILTPPYLKQIFRRTGMLAAAAILVLLMLVYWHEQSLDVDSLLGLSGLQPEDFDHLFANY